MNTSRRHAIRLGICATASLVAVGLSGAAPSAAQQGPQAAPVDGGAWLRRDLFESCLGESWRIRTPSMRVALRLTSVDDPSTAGSRGVVGDENNFVVVLRGPRLPKLAQGTYKVDSRSLGEFDLFLVPGTTTKAGTVYTATFNRLA